MSDLNVVFNTLTGDSFSKAEVKQNKCGAQIEFELKSKDYKLTVRLKALESDYQLSIDGVTGRGTEKETFAIGKDKKESAGNNACRHSLRVCTGNRTFICKILRGKHRYNQRHNGFIIKDFKRENH